MTSEKPRRKWNIARWLLVFAFVAMAWSGWRVYAFRSALAEAKALGWEVEYSDPVATIRKNWKSAFKKETWQDSVTAVGIPTSESFEQHLALIHRLNPKGLGIGNARTLRDLSALKLLDRLQTVGLTGCTGIPNVDALENLPALQNVYIEGCAGLTNADVLKNLSALQQVSFKGCTGLANVDALKNLSALQLVVLQGCTGLTNVDGLKNLSALRVVLLDRCTGLTNVDALKNLSALQLIDIKGCTGLTPESVAALRAALPDTEIYGP